MIVFCGLKVTIKSPLFSRLKQPYCVVPTNARSDVGTSCERVGPAERTFTSKNNSITTPRLPSCGIGEIHKRTKARRNEPLQNGHQRIKETSPSTGRYLLLPLMIALGENFCNFREFLALSLSHFQLQSQRRISER